MRYQTPFMGLNCLKSKSGKEQILIHQLVLFHFLSCGHSTSQKEPIHNSPFFGYPVHNCYLFKCNEKFLTS